MTEHCPFLWGNIKFSKICMAVVRDGVEGEDGLIENIQNIMANSFLKLETISHRSKKLREAQQG